MTERATATAIVLGILVILTLLRTHEAADAERRLVEQRQGDLEQLAGNLTAGCWLPGLLFILVVIVFAAAGYATRD